MVLGNIGRTIRDSISGTIRGTGDILEDTVSAARALQSAHCRVPER